MINVTIWNEFIHEQKNEVVKKIYPKGMHDCIKEFLEKDKKLKISAATLEEKDHGLTEAKLNETNMFALSFTIRIEALKPHSKTLTNRIATNACKNAETIVRTKLAFAFVG